MSPTLGARTLLGAPGLATRSKGRPLGPVSGMPHKSESYGADVIVSGWQEADAKKDNDKVIHQTQVSRPFSCGLSAAYQRLH